MKNTLKKLLLWRKKSLLWSEFENICAKYNALGTGCVYKPQKPTSTEFDGFCEALRSQVLVLSNTMKNDLGDDKPYALALAALELRTAGLALKLAKELAW